MPTLNEVLSQADPLLVTAQEHLDWLNTVGESTDDTTLYTVRQLGIVLGGDLPNLGIVLGTLQAAAAQNPIVSAYFQTLNTTGLDFSNDTVRGMVATLSAGWPTEVKEAVESIGVIPGKPLWEELGLSQPTIEEIQKIILVNKLQQIAADLQSGIQNGSLTTMTEVKASADVMFDSAITALGG